MAAKKSSDPLQVLPGIGPAAAGDLRLLGIHKVADLVGRNPQQLYDELCERTACRQDRCVLYVFRSAIYCAESGDRSSADTLWWNWKARVHPNER